MSLVSSLLQAIVRVDGEAMVMHAGDKPYVVSPTGQVELASRGLTLEAVNGIVGQLLPPEIQSALEEFGAIQYELPATPELASETFTVVAARGGDDVWVEIRRRRVVDDDYVPDELFAHASPRSAAVAPAIATATASTLVAAVHGSAAPLNAPQPAAVVSAVGYAVAPPQQATASVAIGAAVAEPIHPDDDLAVPAATHLWPDAAAGPEVAGGARASEVRSIDTAQDDVTGIYGDEPIGIADRVSAISTQPPQVAAAEFLAVSAAMTSEEAAPAQAAIELPPQAAAALPALDSAIAGRTVSQLENHLPESASDLLTAIDLTADLDAPLEGSAGASNFNAAPAFIAAASPVTEQTSTKVDADGRIDVPIEVEVRAGELEAPQQSVAGTAAIVLPAETAGAAPARDSAVAGWPLSQRVGHAPEATPELPTAVELTVEIDAAVEIAAGASDFDAAPEFIAATAVTDAAPEFIAPTAVNEASSPNVDAESHVEAAVELEARASELDAEPQLVSGPAATATHVDADSHIEAPAELDAPASRLEAEPQLVGAAAATEPAPAHVDAETEAEQPAHVEARATEFDVEVVAAAAAAEPAAAHVDTELNVEEPAYVEARATRFDAEPAVLAAAKSAALDDVEGHLQAPLEVEARAQEYQAAPDIVQPADGIIPVVAEWTAPTQVEARASDFDAESEFESAAMATEPAAHVDVDIHVEPPVYVEGRAREFEPEPEVVAVPTAIVPIVAGWVVAPQVDEPATEVDTTPARAAATPAAETTSAFADADTHIETPVHLEGRARETEAAPSAAAAGPAPSWTEWGAPLAVDARASELSAEPEPIAPSYDDEPTFTDWDAPAGIAPDASEFENEPDFLAASYEVEPAFVSEWTGASDDEAFVSEFDNDNEWEHEPGPDAEHVSGHRLVRSSAPAEASESAEAPSPAVVLPISRSPIRTEAPPPLLTDATLSGLERLLRLSSARGASALYLSSDSRPSVRVDGELQILDGEPVHRSRDVEALLLTLMTERSHEALRTGALTEWICDIDGVGRVRCMSFRDHRGPGGVFRLMPTRSASVDQLGLPKHVQSLATEAEGLVLVAGPRSSGKRTLMAAFVDLMNRTRRDHIIMIEREVNIVHERGSSFISQREVRGSDDDMLAAARSALREDPDVLVIEDLRTDALVDVALEAAASGRLVVAGFSAHSAAGAIDRIIDLYPAEQRRQVQFALAASLRGVIVQVLLRKVGGGRLPAREVLLNTPAVSSAIAEGKTSQLPMVIEGGRRYGMMPINDALVGLVESGVVDGRDAYLQSTDRPGLVAALNRHGIDTSFVERLA